jgi:hypothetical protein
MARLKLNRPETVPTFVNLPRTTRDKLEAMIGQGDIKSLTDAMVVAIDAGTKQIQKQAAAKRPSDRP